MKCYFDHRNFTGLYITLLIDGVTEGYCFLQKNKITTISIPENAKEIEIYCSFRKAEDCKKLKKEEVRSDFVPQRKEKLSLKHYKKIDDRWKFPYYLRINVEKNKEDILFYPAVFSEGCLQGALYYQSYFCSGEKCFNAELMKDYTLEKEIKTFRRKGILKNLIGGTVACIIMLLAAKQIIFNDLPSPEARAAIGFAILGAIFTPICFCDMLGCFMYRGMINFGKISEKH